MSSPPKNLGTPPLWGSSKIMFRDNIGWVSLLISAVIFGLASVSGDGKVDLPWPWAIAGAILGSITTNWYLRGLGQQAQLKRETSDEFLADFQFFDQYLTQRMRERQNMALLHCKIDCFKQFIEAYGLSAGDDCGGQLYEALKKSVRKGDLVTRMGPETFLVFFPNIDENIAIQIAERVRSQIEQLNIPHDTSAISQVVTISGGLAFRNSDDTLTSTEFLDVAKHLLSLSTRRGHNQITNRLQGLFADISPEQEA